MPLIPNSPNVPVLGGTKGTKCPASKKTAPATITSSTTVTLITTTTLLTLADSLTPTTSSAVTSAVMITAGRLNTAVTVAPSAMATAVPGAALSVAGNCRPIWCSSVTRLPDQPTATVAAPSAYSRMRSQPMIHATNSPSVA